MKDRPMWSEELLAERCLEEVRENIQIGFDGVVDKPRYRSVAAKIYASLCMHWYLSDPDAAALLDIPLKDYQSWKMGNADSMSADNLEKISYLLGIFKTLFTWYSGHEERVKAWLTRKNDRDVFTGRTPFEVLSGSDVDVFRMVRQQLSADLV